MFLSRLQKHQITFMPPSLSIFEASKWRCASSIGSDQRWECHLTVWLVQLGAEKGANEKPHQFQKLSIIIIYTKFKVQVNVCTILRFSFNVLIPPAMQNMIGRQSHTIYEFMNPMLSLFSSFNASLLCVSQSIPSSLQLFKYPFQYPHWYALPSVCVGVSEGISRPTKWNATKS